MSNQIFDPNINYVQRFINNYSKKVRMPNFDYLDAKLHPKYKDHVVVLSKNEFPKGTKMTYGWEPPVYDINYMSTDEKFSAFFEQAIKEAEQLQSEKKDKFSKTFKSKTVSKAVISNSMKQNSAQLESADTLLKQADEIFKYENDGDSSSSYEGGNESDSKEENDEKQKKKAKAEISRDEEEDEKQMDSILKDEQSIQEMSKRSDEDLIAEASKLVYDDEPDLEMKAETDGRILTEEQKSDRPKDRSDLDKEEKKEIKKSKTNSSNDQKDENLTSAPKDETTRTLEEEKEHEENKDEEDIPDKEDQNPPQKTLDERFNELDDDLKQFVVNQTGDAYLSNKKSRKFMYQGYAKNENAKQGYVWERLNPEGFTIPENERPFKESQSYQLSDYDSYTTKKAYKGFEYQPRILREKLQISLWRIDNCGVVKTKDRYFTPTHERFSHKDFSGFNIFSSLDCENIILEEKDAKTESLIVVLDAFTLEVKSETVIKFVDDTLKVPDAGDEFDEYYDDFSSPYCTKSGQPRFYVWGKGRFIF